jgi:V8-like Glu-specific endopeptidase
MSPIRFRFLAGPERGTSRSFSTRRIRIGRSRSADLVLPDEETPLASGEHVEIARDWTGWRLRDLASKNGTTLNGVPVKTARLQHGDQIGLGGAPVLECELPRSFAWRAWLVGLLVALAGAVAFVWSRLPAPAGFERAAQRSVAALYLVAEESDDGRTAIGSAFAVGRELLATNAHVALALEARGALATGGALAVASDTSGTGRRVVRITPHPSYERGKIENDVALLHLEEGPALSALPLASTQQLAALRRGMRVAAFGFPAAATDVRVPRGRLSEDVLGDIRDGRFLESGLRVTPGMSGSPIFTPDGTVVGIVVGGDFAAAGKTTVSSGVNWGIVVTPLRELLAAGD